MGTFRLIFAKFLKSLGWLVVFSSLGVVGYQLILWKADNIWRWIPLTRFVEKVPHTQYEFLNITIDTIFRMPLALDVFAVGMGLVAIAGFMGE